jgi:hypothetical protein
MPRLTDGRAQSIAEAAHDDQGSMNAKDHEIARERGQTAEVAENIETGVVEGRDGAKKPELQGIDTGRAGPRKPRV